MATIKATPRMRYCQHKASARQRGIEFDLTFDEWWAIWQPHYAQRGRGSGHLQMCRTGDVGPYAVGNVRIDTMKSNMREAADVRHRNCILSGRLPRGDRSTGVPDWMRRYAPRERIRLIDDAHEAEEESY